jgi:hypothetical protein
MFVNSEQRQPMELVPEVSIALQTLEALYFFTQGVKGESGGAPEKIRAIYTYLLPREYLKLVADLERDVELVRDHYGALAPDAFYRDLLSEAASCTSPTLVKCKLITPRTSTMTSTFRKGLQIECKSVDKDAV